MLKGAIYLNIFILFAMSLLFLMIKFDNEKDLRNLKKTIVIYIIFNIINFLICSNGIVQIGWDSLYLLPIILISFILTIISIYRVNKRINNLNSNTLNNSTSKIYIIMIIIPILVFIIPFIYELYLINNCTYLLHYNYQNGFVQSDDTYIAIVNNKPVTITLLKNIFERKGTSVNEIKYNIKYTNDIEISTTDSNYNETIIENENIKNIAIDAKNRYPSANEAYIDYFKEEGCAIISLVFERENGVGSVLGEYFYYNNTYIKSIKTHGDLESIIYYGN